MNHIPSSSIPIAVLLLTATSLAAATVRAAEAPCADASQAAAVRAAFARPALPAPFAAAMELKLPEAAVVSALPANQAHGIAATHFAAVWKSLQSWEDAVFVVMKGGNVFETHGRIMAGEPSKRSNYFNLRGEGAGVGGHLRPDLLSSIYALSLPGKESVTRGVIFYDKAGDQVFGVYVPGEGATPPASLVKAFETTAAAMRTLPAVCARPAA